MTTWNLEFFKTLAEQSIAAGSAAFAASWGVSSSFNLHDLYVAAGVAGVVALYTFAKGLGASQFAAKLRGDVGLYDFEPEDDLE